MRRQLSRQPRRGLSLLEVLVALAVFLLSYIAIHQLMNLATNHAIEVAYRNRATQLAQRKLAEMFAGVESFQSSGDSSFDEPDDSEYSWSSNVETYPNEDNLSVVSVTVSRPFNNSTLSVTLTQMMVNPTVLGSSQDVQALPLSSTNSSSSSSNGTSGSSGTTGNSGSTTPMSTPAAITPTGGVGGTGGR
jgi:general secretion pathway protein I